MLIWNDLPKDFFRNHFLLELCFWGKKRGENKKNGGWGFVVNSICYFYKIYLSLQVAFFLPSTSFSLFWATVITASSSALVSLTLFFDFFCCVCGGVTIFSASTFSASSLLVFNFSLQFLCIFSFFFIPGHKYFLFFHLFHMFFKFFFSFFPNMLSLGREYSCDTCEF